MKWIDFFYFSKGERRALTLLLSLIVAAWLVLFLTDGSSLRRAETSFEEKSGYVRDTRISVETTEIAAIDSGTFENKEAASPKTFDRAAKRVGRELRQESLRSSRPSATSVYIRSRRTALPRIDKLPAGSIVELNTADTTLLKKVPGIGSTFARRIVKYRNLLGGFYSVRQLSEVYGIDEERYRALAPWFTVDPAAIRPWKVNQFATDTFRYHPYLDWRQRRAIRQQLKQKGRLSGWESLQLLEEFTPADRERLAPYLSFE